MAGLRLAYKVVGIRCLDERHGSLTNPLMPISASAVLTQMIRIWIWALQVDITTDINYKAQLLQYIRFIDSDKIIILNQFLFCKNNCLYYEKPRYLLCVGCLS